tara:strand:+ start:342 stop:794 length:453 start_codon:yes stop_codon:yes gene_type:complete
MVLHYKKFIKFLFITLIFYNLISLFILFAPFKSLKYSFWKLTPYDFNFALKFPNYMEDLSLLNEYNREKVSSFLKKNTNRNILNVNYWNKRFFIDEYSKDTKNNFEKSFTNTFLLTKNNKRKNFELKKYFIFNYSFFSEKSKKIIIDNYN